MVQRCLTIEDLRPAKYGPAYTLPDNPFMQDYIAASLLYGIPVDVAVFNGNPFGLTVQALHFAAHARMKDSAPCIIVDVPAHNLEVSIEEFGKLGMKYPFTHMTDPFLWDLYTRHIKIADVVLCPSRLSEEYIKRKLDLKNRIVIIPHGTDMPSEVPPLPEVFTVGHLGQNGPDKGQIYLVKAWNIIVEGRRPSDHIRILLAGYGTESWGGLGYLSDEKRIYRECSVYVQPTVTEGFGIPVLEAMAHGRPVIVTSGCGSSELVEDAKDGFVIPIRNPEEIAAKIRYFHDNPSELKRMGQNAREKAGWHTWEGVEKAYESLYLEVAG